MQTSDLIARARAGDDSAFRDLAEAHSRELQVHCYRILGSVQDAEDALQETLVSAWRNLGDFGQRSSLRTWLYQIATNRCLSMLRADSRRPRTAAPLPGLTLPEPTRVSDAPPWLQPYPGRSYRAVPTRANRQPAFGLYMADPHTGIYPAYGLHVITIAGDRITAITGFDASVMPRFGLPRTLPGTH